MVEMSRHSQTKGRATRELKLRPKPTRLSSTLPKSAEGEIPSATRLKLAGACSVLTRHSSSRNTISSTHMWTATFLQDVGQ